MIQVKSFTFNPFLENTYVVFDDSKEAIIIDPGCYENYEKEMLDLFISENSLEVKRLINTHCHIDHVFGNHHIKSKYGVKLEIHENDIATLKSVEVYAPNYGFQHFDSTEADKFIKEGDVIEFGQSAFDIIFVPGHAPGHTALVNREQKICLSGDVLFRESIGRTDLPGGDFDTLIKSIHEKMFILSDDVIVYSGHGPETTIGHEKVYNPFCAIRI